MTKDLASVSEIFGPTIQGEGPSAGKPCGFVRLGRCNLTCSWCDTPYTWDWSGQNGTTYDPATELRDISVEQIFEQVVAMDVPMVVITGGEPLLQRSALTALAAAFKQADHRVEIETNGTLAIWPELHESVDQFNVSVKLANSGIPTEKRIVEDAVKSFVDNSNRSFEYVFKFVVKDAVDLDEVAAIQQRFSIPADLVWVMPEGVEATKLTQAATLLEPEVKARNWSFTNRLHVLKWGDKRGV